MEPMDKPCKPETLPTIVLQKAPPCYARDPSLGSTIPCSAVQERLAARLPPSRAERALEEIAHGQALWKKFKDSYPEPLS